MSKHFFTLTLRELNVVEIMGSADATISPQDAAQLAFIIIGSGEITASGTVDTLTARILGSGTINAGDREAQAEVALLDRLGHLCPSGRRREISRWDDASRIKRDTVKMTSPLAARRAVHPGDFRCATN